MGWVGAVVEEEMIRETGGEDLVANESWGDLVWSPSGAAGAHTPTSGEVGEVKSRGWCKLGKGELLPDFAGNIPGIRGAEIE